MNEVVVMWWMEDSKDEALPLCGCQKDAPGILSTPLLVRRAPT